MTKITTPSGISVWPKLTTPDAYQDNDLEYSCALRFDAQDESTQELVANLEQAFEENKKTLNEWNAKAGRPPIPPAKLKKTSYRPWGDEEDKETGEPTGFIVVKAKLKAERKMGDSMMAQRPAVFDEFGEAWDLDKPIWGGSKIAMSVEAIPYYIPTTGYSITLRLKGAQVTELVSGSGESTSASDFGFKVEKKVEPEPVDAFADGEFSADDL